MIEKLCSAMNFCVFRLDGDTPVHVRQKIVDQFNTASDPNSVFLLSKKAGNYSSFSFSQTCGWISQYVKCFQIVVEHTTKD